MRAERDGDTRGAIELSRRAAALDPLSEEAHRSLMRRLADAGDRPGALTVYSELRTRLLKTLRIGPSDETRELAESLRAPPGGELVPTQLKRVDRALFVGREAELARLRRLRTAVSETTRVGLIAGEAGSGKTRLGARFAVETAAEGTAVFYGSCGEQALVPLEPFAEASGRAGSRASTRRWLRSASRPCRENRCCSCSTTCSGPTG